MMQNSLSRRTLLGAGGVAAGAIGAAGLTAPGAQIASADGRGSIRAVFTPGADWLDTDGNQIDAFSGGMYIEGGTYYWVGLSREDGTAGYNGINLYSSTDLAEWTNQGSILAPTDELGPPNTVGRPKIVYNEATSTYVMWFKRKDYRAPVNDARPCVAISAALDEPFTYLTDFYPAGYNCGDLTLYQEDDGTAYLPFSAPQRYGVDESGVRRTVIMRLTDDYRGVEPEPVWVGPVDKREAPAMFKRGSTYYMITSGSTGWTANQATYRTATSVAGPWSELKLLGDADTYDSQADFVFPVRGRSTTTWVYAGSRHVPPPNMDDSRQVWLPLTFSGDDQLTLDFHPEWTLNTTSGRWYVPD